MKFRAFALFCAAFLLLVPGAVAAAVDAPPTDPAAKQIAAFDDALLDSMKQGKQLGAMGRFNKLKPVIDRTFDLTAMTAAAVGSTFTSMSAADQQSLVNAFERMTVASYAHNFGSYSGESFTINPAVLERGEHKLVQTTLVIPKDSPHAFNYVMAKSGGTWKVIDVLLEGYVSQAATKRADFSSTITSGGAPALVKRLNTISDGLMAG